MTLRLLRPRLTLAIILLSCMGTCLQPACAQTDSVGIVLKDFNIPAGALDDTLIAISEQTGTALAYRPELVAGKKAAAVVGRLSTYGAINRALQGTGLQLFRTSAGGLTVQPINILAHPLDTSQETRRTPDSVTALSPAEYLEVRGVVKSFVATNSGSATRTDTSLMDTPQSVSVITRDVITSTQAITVEDTLRRVSGITIGAATGTAGVDTIVARGFTAAVTTDGLNQADSTSSSSGITMPAIGIARIDVLKGADSILAGNSQPGGVVNVVRKRPEEEKTLQVNAQIATFGDGLISADYGGAFTTDKHFMGRFLISGNRAATSYLGYEGKKIGYVAPSLRWKFDATDVTIGYEVNSQRNPPAVTTYLGLAGPVRIGRPLGNRSESNYSNNQTPYFDFTQNLPLGIQLEVKGQYQRTDQIAKIWSYILYNVDGTGAYVAQGQRSKTIAYSGSVTLKKKIITGPVSQNVVANFSYQNSTNIFAGAFGSAYTEAAPLTEVYLPKVRGIPNWAGSPQYTRQNQISLQDQITMFSRFHILASITRAHIRNVISFGYGEPSTPHARTQWLPNIGGVINLTKNINLYANYMRSFNDQSSYRTSANSVAAPSRGKTIEAGVKTEWFSRRLQVSSDIYKASANNTPYSNFPSLYYIISPSGQTTRGVDFNVTGKLFTGLSVIANFSYTNVKKNVSNQMSQFLGKVPKETYSVWATYDIGFRALPGFGIGVGVTGRSGYLGGASGEVSGAKAYRMPSQQSVDLSVFYKKKNISMNLGFKNLLNSKLYGDYAYSNAVQMLLGRTIMLTMTYNDY
ncbi:TonB-dependent receptor [Acetobacter sacchari]|uniref:TonB-dependent receptor n=1 Tax=Acetobacter sacchari TaxID=2661687 RepID=A0ABS3LXJ0_9PROT|nr:TonB-dependent receptor [Acetobacter sacchari]MBO1360571.1 TonB-dependent receptor [Acetobacter sacchari]